MRAALRHRLQQQGERAIFRGGDLSVDLVRRIVMVRGEEVRLSPREYDILRLLVAHAGKVLTHKFILREVWGGETDVQYLRVYIRALRQKLEADPERPQQILTETGRGLPAARAGLGPGAPRWPARRRPDPEASSPPDRGRWPGDWPRLA